MLVKRVAVTCIADVRLRGVCAILLRHAGYRVIEAPNVTEAMAAVEAQAPAMLVAGIAADPDDRLTLFAKDRKLTYVRLAPDVPIEVLLKLFEETQ